MNPVFFGISESNYSIISKKNLRKPNPIEYSQENKLVGDEKLPTNIGIINISADKYSLIKSENLLVKNPTENACYKVLVKKEIYEELYI